MKNIVNLIVVLSIAFSSFIPQHPMAVAGYGLNRASEEDTTPEPTATSEPIMTDTPEIIQPTELTPTEVATEIQPNPTSPEPYSTETPANPVEEATPTLEETPIPTIELTPTETPAEITETPEAGSFVDDYDWASDKFSDSFALRMTPPLLRTGETVALHWNIRNFDELTGSSLAIEISYPQELDPETSPEYITGENLIRIENPAATGKISFTVLAEASYAEISAVLYLDGQRYDTNQVALASPQTTSPDQKMVYESFNERSSLEVPAEAAEVPLDIISIPLIDARAGEIGASAQAMEFLAYDSAGNAVHTFDEPVTITIHYDENLIEGYESGIYLSYFDEQTMQWTDVPADLDTDTDTISASVTHFSIYDINVDDYWLSPVMALPDMAQVSNFTGAGTYSYPIEVPESPAGLKPDLSLTYNSQIVDSANAFSQADWTGMGWSLTIPYIYADLHDMDDSKDDQYYIIINGRRGALLQAWDSTIQFGNNETGTVYHTRLESYWKIIQHNKENFKPW